MKLPDRLASWIAREAKRRGTTKSALVREIIEQHSQSGGASPLDAASDLCGSASSGLGDLSRNRKRMRGFGR
jgi:hypothetical protein